MLQPLLPRLCGRFDLVKTQLQLLRQSLSSELLGCFCVSQRNLIGRLRLQQ
jgi:hypothetical protein